MPHAAISLLAGRSKEAKENAAKAIQSVLAQELGVKDHLVSVSIEDVDDKKWSAHISKFQDVMVIEPSYLKGVDINAAERFKQAKVLRSAGSARAKASRQTAAFKATRNKI
jgi:phenylpyruvate tautomerase PptA (4-oxalocrotonate tautomerase family)